MGRISEWLLKLADDVLDRRISHTMAVNRIMRFGGHDRATANVILQNQLGELLRVDWE